MAKQNCTNCKHAQNIDDTNFWKCTKEPPKSGVSITLLGLVNNYFGQWPEKFDPIYITNCAYFEKGNIKPLWDKGELL